MKNTEYSLTINMKINRVWQDTFLVQKAKCVRTGLRKVTRWCI